MALRTEEFLDQNERIGGTLAADVFIFDEEGSGSNRLFGGAGNDLFRGVGLSPTVANGGPGGDTFQIGDPSVPLSLRFSEREVSILDLDGNDRLRAEMLGQPDGLRFGRDAELNGSATRPFDASVVFSREGSTLLLETTGDRAWDFSLSFGQNSAFHSATAADFDVGIRDLSGGPGEYAIEMSPVETDLTPVFRFFNEGTGGHFFTPNAQEMQNVHNNLALFNHEGVGFYAFDQNNAPDNAQPVFRFFNEASGGHFYTINEQEAENVRNNLEAFRDEGVGFFAFENAGAEPEATPVYRFFNEASGGHFFTPSAEEAEFVRNNLDAFRDEGIGFYAFGEIA